MRPTLTHFFADSDLRNSHEGLAELARQDRKIDVDKMQAGECLMFINTTWTAYKLLTRHPSGEGHFVVHYRHPKRHRLNISAVREIGLLGGKISYAKALKSVMEKAISVEYKVIS